jgi:hypothetical protein
MLNRLMRSDRVRVDRIAGLRAMLLLHPLLLLLLLLIYRGPAQPDTTRATGQSTEGRGGQLLGLLLLTSSVSIPGELQLLLLLMRRMLLLLSWFAGRLLIGHPAKVLDGSRPAERSRPAELIAEVNELGEVKLREPLVDHCTVDFGVQRRPTSHLGGCGAVGSITLNPPHGFTRDDVPQAIGLVVGAVVSELAVPLRTAARIHRP